MYVLNKNPDSKIKFGPFSYEEMTAKMALKPLKVIYHKVYDIPIDQLGLTNSMLKFENPTGGLPPSPGRSPSIPRMVSQYPYDVHTPTPGWSTTYRRMVNIHLPYLDDHQKDINSKIVENDFSNFLMKF